MVRDIPASAQRSNDLTRHLFHSTARSHCAIASCGTLGWDQEPHRGIKGSGIAVCLTESCAGAVSHFLRRARTVTAMRFSASLRGTAGNACKNHAACLSQCPKQLQRTLELRSQAIQAFQEQKVNLQSFPCDLFRRACLPRHGTTDDKEQRSHCEIGVLLCRWRFTKRLLFASLTLHHDLRAVA